MAKNDSSKSFEGVMDGRPGSSTTPEKGQGGHSTPPRSDWRGIEDSRPSSSPKSQSVPVSGKE